MFAPPQGGVFGQQRSSLAEKIQGTSGGSTHQPRSLSNNNTSTTSSCTTRYPALLRRLIKALPLFDPQQMSSLGKNTYGGPLLQAMLRAAAQDE